VSPPQIQLEYAPPLPTRRRTVRRWAMVLLLVLAGWVAVKHGEEIVSALHRKWVQSRCSTFEYADRTVIYDSDPAAGAALLRDKAGDYVRLTDTSVWPAEAVVRREPVEWSRLKDLMFNSRQFWPPGVPAPKALVHRLRAANGEERIVALIVAPDIPKSGSQSLAGQPRHIQLVAAVVRPSTTFSEMPRWDGNIGFLRGGFESAKRLRFYAAQIDPNSPSTFALRYEMDDAGGMIDGALENDGSISLKIRDGPAKGREWYSEDGR